MYHTYANGSIVLEIFDVKFDLQCKLSHIPSIDWDLIYMWEYLTMIYLVELSTIMVWSNLICFDHIKCCDKHIYNIHILHIHLHTHPHTFTENTYMCVVCAVYVRGVYLSPCKGFLYLYEIPTRIFTVTSGTHKHIYVYIK